MKANALRIFQISHPGHANGDRSNAGLNLSFWQVAIAHNTPAPLVVDLRGVLLKELADLGFHGHLKQLTSSLADHCGQSVGDCWCTESV